MEEVFFAALFGVLATAAFVSTIGWVRASHRIHRLETRLLALLDRADRAPTSADPLAEAVDRLEGQVERLAKGQAFLSDLVAGKRDRLQHPRIAPAPHVTPS